MSISIAAVSSATAGVPFSVGGILTGYTKAPVLDYADTIALTPVTNLVATASPGGISVTWSPARETATWVALPTGSNVTTNAFLFTHPGLPAGNHILEVTDGTNTGAIHYVIAAAVPTPTPTPITHTSIIAKVVALEGMITGITNAQRTMFAQIISDLGSLTP